MGTFSDGPVKDKLTNEEIELLVRLINSHPIQGTIQTLPGFLQSLVVILKKLESMRSDNER